MANMNRTKVITDTTQNFLISTVGSLFPSMGELKSILYLYLFQRTIQKPVNAVNKAIDAAIEEGCCKIRR